MSLVFPHTFVPWFRAVAPYIHAYHGKTFVVAMAGERMRLPGWSEVSGVCTHPDHRGRGHAAALMRTVAARMIARGKTPWLTSYATNAGAIALYETLGYRHRADMIATVLVRA